MEQNDYNVESVLRAKNVAEERIKEVMDLRRRVAQFQMTGEGSKEELNAEIAALKGERWFRDTLLGQLDEPFDRDSRSYMSLDPEPIWRKVNVPVVALWGEEDLVVPATKSRATIDRTLRSGNGKMFDLREFPRSGHGVGVNRKTNEGWDFPRLAPGYQDLLVDSVKRMAARRR